jgi:hypothetical protein
MKRCGGSTGCCANLTDQGMAYDENEDEQGKGCIFGANQDLEHVVEWTRQDAANPRPHPVYQQANALKTEFFIDM